MADENIQQPQDQSQQKPAPDTQPKQNGDNGQQQPEPSWLKERLDRAEKKAVKGLLKDLGIDKLEDLKAVVDTARAAKTTSQELATARQEAEQVKAQLAQVEAARVADRVDAVIVKHAQAIRAEHPQDVVDLLRKGDLKSVVNDKGEIDEAKIETLVKQAQKDRPTWFRSGGVGSPSNRNGVAPEAGDADKQKAIRDLDRNLRNKF